MSVYRIALWAFPLAIVHLSVAGAVWPGANSVRMSADGRALEIKRPADAEAVRVDVLERCGNNDTGAAKLKKLHMGKDSLSISWGKACAARVSLKTLDVECTPCD